MGKSPSTLTPNTLKAYTSAWKGFVRFCEQHEVSSLPAGRSTVARYLRQRAFAGKSASAIRVDYSAIKAAHARANGAGPQQRIEDPTEDDLVRTTMRDLTYKVRERRRPVNWINLLTQEEFEAIKATAYIPRVGKTGRTETKEHALKRGKVDVALIAVMRDCTLCRYEAIRITWGAVVWRPDGSALLNVAPRKDNEIGYTGYLTKDTAEALKAIRSLRARKGMFDDSGERIFSMTTKSISNRIAAACRMAGL